MLKIYGNPVSTCTRKVLMTLAETNTPAELITIDFASGEHKQPPHLARQPFGRVPALDDDGFAMFESRAMCRYLDERAGGALVPRDAKARGRMEQWISVETAEFSPHAMKFVYEHVFKRPQDAATLEAAQKALAVTCDVLEKRLATSPFLAGEAFTLADICFMPYLEYCMATPAREIFTPYAALGAWWSKLSERPTWRKVAGKG
jgi:glutathione S-transferase